MKNASPDARRRFLLASDFDQTLSFNDSGIVLSEMLGVANFHERVSALSGIHLVQQGGELAYLLLHDPDFGRVRREHLVEAGKHIRLKRNIRFLSRMLDNLEGSQFDFYVISAAPEEVIQSALDGIVEPSHIIGTRFDYDPSTNAIRSLLQVTAGYGKVTALEELRLRLQVSHDRVVYVGDGSSDVHVMLHVNRRDGLTIAVSESPFVTQIARRTILSDDALSVVVPILEEVFAWDATRIRAFFDAHGYTLQDWSKVRTDSLTISGGAPPAPLA